MFKWRAITSVTSLRRAAVRSSVARAGRPAPQKPWERQGGASTSSVTPLGPSTAGDSGRKPWEAGAGSRTPACGQKCALFACAGCFATRARGLAALSPRICPHFHLSTFDAGSLINRHMAAGFHALQDTYQLRGVITRIPNVTGACAAARLQALAGVQLSDAPPRCHSAQTS